MANRLTSFLNQYFARRGVVTRKEWRQIRGVMRTSENTIIQKIRDYDLADWQLANLRNILASIQSTVTIFDAQFKNMQFEAMATTGELEAVQSNIMTKVGKLVTPPLSIDPTAVVRSIYPVTEGIIDMFIADERKILTSEISLGIAEGKSQSEVAKAIHEKFASSNMSYHRAERISTTEMLRSSSFVARERQLEIAEYNPDAVKIWVNAHKPGARVTHIDAERRYTENPIPVNEPFKIDSESGMMPRDFSFSAKNTVWCACTMITTKASEAAGISARIGEFAKMAEAA